MQRFRETIPRLSERSHKTEGNDSVFEILIL